MKHKILFAFLLLSLNGFSQNLINYKVDEKVSLNIPEDFEELESAGQKFTRAFVGNAILLVSKSNEKYSGIKIQKESQLLKFYEGIQNGILKATKGQLIEKEIIEVNGLKILTFSSTLTIENEPKVYDNFIFLLEGNTYSIQFICPSEKEKDFDSEKTKIISSISFSVKN